MNNIIELKNVIELKDVEYVYESKSSAKLSDKFIEETTDMYNEKNDGIITKYSCIPYDRDILVFHVVEKIDKLLKQQNKTIYRYNSYYHDKMKYDVLEFVIDNKNNNKQNKYKFGILSLQYNLYNTGTYFYTKIYTYYTINPKSTSATNHISEQQYDDFIVPDFDKIIDEASTFLSHKLVEIMSDDWKKESKENMLREKKTQL